MAIRTVGDLINYLVGMVNDEEWIDEDSVVMLDVAGRWTGIKGLNVSSDGTDVVLVKSED